MSVERLKAISLNPIFASKIIQSFLTGYNGTVEFKTLFYVLPMIIYRDSRDKLETANAASRINTLFGSKQEYTNTDIKVSGKVNLTGFLERFEAFNGLTKQAIIVLSVENKILFNGKIQLLKKIDYKDYSKNIRVYLRAAFYLGIILSKSSLQSLENFMGVYSA